MTLRTYSKKKWVLEAIYEKLASDEAKTVEHLEKLNSSRQLETVEK